MFCMPVVSPKLGINIIRTPKIPLTHCFHIFTIIALSTTLIKVVLRLPA